MTYAPCPNCDACWSVPRVAGNESMRERVHEAGCPGDGPVSPPAGIDPDLLTGFAIFEPMSFVKLAPTADPFDLPYGVKPNGTKP